MSAIMADLHLHTTASDGLWDAGETVRRAKAFGLTLIAITDHDITSSVPRGIAEGIRQGIQVLSGIELSCGHGEEIHLLGYGFDPEDEALAAFLAGEIRNRQERMHRMLAKLRKMDIHIEPSETGNADTPFMGRMNLASAMVAHGYAKSVADAFSRYLSPGKPGFVPRQRLSVTEGIRTLEGLGAIAVLAHPGRSGLTMELLPQLLPQWQEAGLAGVEAYHASHLPAVAVQYDRLARRHGLLVTGGSDCHGRPDGAQIGDHLPMWRQMQEDVAALMLRLERK